MMNTVELLAPAGSPEALDAAIGEGADAVYLGLKSFNARLRSTNFAYSQFEGALRALHRMGRKIYVTVNTVFEQREADRLYQLLKYLASLGPDGIIVQDFGAIDMIRRHFPSLKIHASTQMNIASARGVNLLSKYGLSRVVLARELSLQEIREIRENTNMELEVFVHGALCVSASGLCLFSGFLGGKSANRGMCTQACRRFYRSLSPDAYKTGGEEEGAYFFSPGDLQLIGRIPDLARGGVNSFKIEGRMKSAEYVGTVVSAYRRVIDSLAGTEEQIARALGDALGILKNDFARTKTVFYFDGDDAPESLNWLRADQSGGTGIPLGTILRVKGAGEARRGLISPEGPVPVPGDSVRFHRADDSERRSYKLSSVEEGPWIPLPDGFGAGDAVYLIQTKAMSKRYPELIPRKAASFRRAPGRDQAPPAEIPNPPKNKARDFPEGLYGAVSQPEDLYLLQSERPVRVMLDYTRKTADWLLKKRQPLPFSPGEVFLTLNPYFPQKQERILAEEIPELIRLGYRQFVVNNLGHYAYFRNTETSLIAGPYLYVFNSWARAFILSLGTDFFISPPENNRQNLERTVEPKKRQTALISVFSYPALFRIRADLGGLYSFGSFSDSLEEEFRLVCGPEGSFVYPEKPFSIVDKIPFLKEAGFNRFILDFSGRSLKKAEYKDIMRAVKNAAPLPNTSRFNWKNGFFQVKETVPGD
ncbi:MAG: U32 family peptidase [Treponema sp.]|jgi:putative protease|nr:U32 family peptidase [Treponema sp.]